jgi:phage terminase large subunit-like protein
MNELLEDVDNMTVAEIQSLIDKIDVAQLDEDELDDYEELAKILEAKRGLEDLYYFDKYILGYSDMSPRTHKPLCDFLEDDTKKKKHIEYPRGNFKSSVGTIGYTVQQVAKNPNVRVLIDNEVYGNSKNFLREIKGHMDNPDILELYPQLEGDKRINDGWTESSVIVKSRTKVLKEPTISCAGVDQIKISMHFDLIIMDDLVSTRNVTTKEQIDKVIEHYKLALSLLEPGGTLIVIGTRYHYADLYGYLLENEKDSFSHMVLPAKWTEESIENIKQLYPDLYTKYGYKVNDLLFPERITQEYLDDQRKSQGPYIFNCNYMLNPVNPEESDFQKEWLQYYKGSLIKEHGKYFLNVEWLGDWKKQALPGYTVPFKVPVRITTTWDPANKKKKSSDHTGGTTVGTDPDNRWFVLNMTRDKFNPKEVVDRIIGENEEFEAEITGIEEEGKETIKFYLVERMKKLAKFFRIKELKTGGVAKEDRIKRLIPRFANGMVFLPLHLYRKNWEGQDIDVIEGFEDEYIYFPLAKKDDVIDSLAYQIDLMVKVRKGKGERREGRAKAIG